MTVPVSILASLVAAAAAIFIAIIGAWGSINSRLGRMEKGYDTLEKGQENLASEIRATRDHIDVQLAAAEKRALAREDAAEKRAIAREAAAEERALAREAAAEERALARHNELMAEIRLWRHHGHDADGNIFFRVPE